MKLRSIQAAIKHTGRLNTHVLAGPGTSQRVIFKCHDYGDGASIYVYGCINLVYYVDRDMNMRDAQDVKDQLLSQGWQEVENFDLAQTIEVIRHAIM